MSDRIDQLREDFRREMGEVSAEPEATALRDRWVGRKSGLLTAEMKTLGRLSPEERRLTGQLLNELKDEIEGELARLESGFAAAREAAQLATEQIDVTLPGRSLPTGHLHPITLLRQRIEDIFVSMGYHIEDGPEVETDFYNFDALNIPAIHPARSRQDTFYISEKLALRSQTSTVQIHSMQRRRPPLRVLAPGRVFRRDTPDATHNPMFYQVEGLLEEPLLELVDDLVGPHQVPGGGNVLVEHRPHQLVAEGGHQLREGPLLPGRGVLVPVEAARAGGLAEGETQRAQAAEPVGHRSGVGPQPSRRQYRCRWPRR